MTIHEASRTLLKSPPELWAECSDATSLSRHLGGFGEIRITRLEPETAVAWEGENASGTVRLEASGWGTRVILTAEETEIPNISEPDSEPETVPEHESATQAETGAEPQAVAEPEPVPEAVAEPEPEPEPVVEPEAVTATEPAAEPVSEVAEPAPKVTEPAPRIAEPAPRVGFFARLFGRNRRLAEVAQPLVEPEPEPVGALATEAEAAADANPEPKVEPEPLSEPAPAPEQAAEPQPNVPVDALTGALDSLGMAHHRPFSRS
jgi:hypothetical protein